MIRRMYILLLIIGIFLSWSAYIMLPNAHESEKFLVLVPAIAVGIFVILFSLVGLYEQFKIKVINRHSLTPRKVKK